MTRGIFDTPPIEVADANWAIISMVSNADVQMYLLSLKSFYNRIGRGKVIAIIDRDMPQHLRAVLQQHVRGIAFVILEDIDTGPCQRGGTWERLIYLLNHAQREYAIQLDSDTLAFGSDLAEVVRCAETNRAFTLSAAGQPVRSMCEYAEDARKITSGYVGFVAERLFDRYEGCADLKYVRASSGFAGFAVGGFEPNEIEKFHQGMQKLLDDDWKKWGTEQCGSNFAVANSPDPCVLPYPKYANFSPELASGVNSFLHFFGTHRYDGDYFAKRGQEVIEQLKVQK